MEKLLFLFALLGGLGSLASIGQFIYVALAYHRETKMVSLEGSKPKVPYGRLMLFLFLTWGAVAFDYYDRHHGYHQQVPQQVFKRWGNDGKEFCYASMNTSRLVNLAEQYELALVCGIEDPTVDILKRTKISVSNLYRIPSDEIFAVVKMRQEMSEALASGRVQVWTAFILLPKGADPAVIHQLTDVESYGGKLVGQELLNSL